MDCAERLPLDCDPLDELLGGGLEHGVITNVYGEAGAGKTNLCIQAVASCVERGGTAVVIDTEGGFSAERFLQMHGDEEGLDAVVLREVTTFAEQQDVLQELPEVVEEHAADLIVVDSLVALYRLHLQDEDVQAVNAELSRQFATLSQLARERDIPVLVTNQVYSRFDEDETVVVGRDVPQYWSKALIALEKDGGDGRRTACIKKHRSRPDGLTTEFYITQDALAAEPEDRDGMTIF